MNAAPDLALPAVSVIMPVLNEERHLRNSVRHILAQDYPGELEVVIALGPSADRTDAIAAELVAEDPRVHTVPNPTGRTPAALNAAIKASRHPVVVRVDGHGMLSPDYIATAVRLLEETGAANVGGVMHAEGENAWEYAVAAAMTSRIGVGNASFHTGGAAAPADTVYLGVFHRHELLATPYDSRLSANEDYDLCTRLRHGGRQVWLEQGLEVGYEARDTYRGLSRQYRSFGEAKVRYWRETGERPSFRQALALAAAGAVILGLATQLACPRRVTGLAAAGMAALVAVDHFADPRERRVRVRAHSIMASVCIVGSWISGIAGEAAR